MFTSLPLYLQHGYWFSDGEFIAADGGFEGDGPVRASFKNPGADANNNFTTALSKMFDKISNALSTEFVNGSLYWESTSRNGITVIAH